MTRDEVIAAYRAVRNTSPASEHQIHVLSSAASMDELISRIMLAPDYVEEKKRETKRLLGDSAATRFDDSIRSHRDSFLCPSDLTVTALPTLNVLLLGQCFFFDWKNVAEIKGLDVRAQQYVVNNPHDIPDSIMPNTADFDLQIMQVPMRAAIPENAYFRLSVNDTPGFEHIFNVSKERTASFIDAMMKFNIKYKLESYICGLIAPQSGLNGRFSKRFSLSNILFYVDKLNEFIAGYIGRFENAHFVDLNAICAVHGKKFSRDDFFAPSMHGGTLTDGDAAIDAARIVVPPPATTLYDYDHIPFVYGAWREILAMHRTLRSLDTVKLVVIDLDDTLWRGLVGEGTAGDIEGWPAGFIEALLHLKQRGILLAIISKNDESVVLREWENILGDRIKIEDFAIRRVNYNPKALNMGEVLSALNLLSRNTVFIDDNPVERESMTAAFPDMRVLGDLPLYLKRTLLWSAETQVVTVSEESSKRTEMIQAQVVRDSQRQSMTREAFLRDLGAAVSLGLVRGADDPRFARAFELINKTNQFNTTGRRMTLAEADAHFERGGFFCTFSVKDKHTAYGLVGVFVCIDSIIEQFVMSCRVAGLDIEIGAVAILLNNLALKHRVCKARLIYTDVNLICRDVFAKSSFSLKSGIESDGIWEKDLSRSTDCPEHLAVSAEELVAHFGENVALV